MVPLRTNRFAGILTLVVFTCLTAGSFAAEKGEVSPLSRALSSVTLFKGLTDGERDSLKAAATLRHGKAGERIIEQGKHMSRMFILLEGRAEVRIDGEPIVTLSGQTLVGEIEFLDGFPASADVHLLEETDLIELNNEALTSLMERQPRLGYVIMHELAVIEARRLRNMNAK